MSSIASINELLANDDPEAIREGIRLAGEQKLEEAIPSLVKHISSQNLGIQDAADRALRKIGTAKVVDAVIPLLQSENVPARNISMDILRALGHTNLDAMTKLTLGDDPDIRIFIVDILGSCKNEIALSVLCKSLLNDSEVNVRYQAAISLGELNFPNAATCLHSALDDEEWVQFAAIEALTKLRAESSIGALIKTLDNCSDLVASTIIDALGEMGNIKTVPMLITKLGSSPTALTNKIVKSIVKILGESSLSLLGKKDQERLVQFMKSALTDEDTEVQDAAVRGLSALKDESALKEMVKLAVSLNPERDRERISFIIQAVAKIGFNPTLNKLLQEGTEAEQLIVVSALKLIDCPQIQDILVDVFWKTSRDIQRLIIDLLSCKPCVINEAFYREVLEKHSDGTILRGALQLLGKYGTPDQAESTVLSMLSHPYNDVKESALDAAVALASPAIKNHFKGMVKDEDPINRMMAIYALGRFGAESYLSELKDALQDENEEVRKLAVEALSVKKPLIYDSIGLIENMLKDESCEVRKSAVDALGGVPGEHIESLLIELLSDQDPWVRARSAEQLGKRNSLKATAALINSLHDESHLVVIKVIDSLKSIGGEISFRALFDFLDGSDDEIQRYATEAIDYIRKQGGE